MIIRVMLTASTAVMLLASPMPTQAGSLEFLHDKVRINGFTCMKDHSHSGKGGAADQATALRKAARDWSDFTSLEYGAAWGNFAIAADKSAKCGPLRESWTCEIDAVPCRM